jgi:hypothetical protein
MKETMLKTLRLMITESWRGQRPLYKVFWLYYVVGAFVVVGTFLLFIQFASLFPSLIALALLFAALAALLTWKAWALFSIWRCAPNSSASTYKFLARAYVVLFVLTVPLSSIEKFKEYRLRGYDTTAKSQIRDAAVAQEAFYAKARTYTDNPIDLYSQGLNANPDVRLAILPGKGGLEKANLIVARHIGSEKAFFFDSTTGEITETTLKDVREAGVQGIDP